MPERQPVAQNLPCNTLTAYGLRITHQEQAMNPELAKMLESKPALYPHQLEKDFPHIPAEIAQRWNTPEIESYFHDLMLDSRGDRDGFSEAVMREIFALFNHWRSLQPPRPRSIDNWADSVG